MSFLIFTNNLTHYGPLIKYTYFKYFSGYLGIVQIGKYWVKRIRRGKNSLLNQNDHQCLKMEMKKKFKFFQRD